MLINFKMIHTLNIQEKDANKMNEENLEKNFRCFLNIPYINNRNLDIIMPKDEPLTKIPAVIYLHGGGWGKGAKDNYGGHLWNLEMIKHGIAAVSVEYTLKREKIFPQQIIDIKNAIRFLRTKGNDYGIDGSKIGIWGHSSGGHLAVLAAASGDNSEWENETSTVVQACATIAGPIDLNNVIKKGDNAAAHLFGKEIETINDAKELVAKANPLNYITEKMPPTLIVHGEKDILVPIEESEKLFKAIPSAQFMRFKSADHFFLNEENDMRTIANHVAAFFDSKLCKHSEIITSRDKQLYNRYESIEQFDAEFYEKFNWLFEKFT